MVQLWRIPQARPVQLLLFISILITQKMGSAGADYQAQEVVLTMSAVEQEALYQVMDAMAGGTDWRVLHPHPCSEDVWPGLLCEQGKDSLLHVTRLDFGYRPNPTCARNASLPPAIAKLAHLRSLFIFQCFSTFNTTIPTSLVKLAPTLQELSLRTNSALVGSIPIELASLSSLELLSLSQNSLTGTIPVQLSKLTALQHLDLSNNGLSGKIPAELGAGLHSLVILDLSVNHLSGHVPISLGSLRMLKKLDLSFNSLQGVLPRELQSLSRLQFLAMNDNILTGPYPEEMARIEGLQYLIMDNNPMNTNLPSFIGSFKSLMALSLSNSGYFGTIPSAYSGLHNLTVMSLDRNKLTGSIPAGLGQLPHIYQLNLSLNNLSGAIPFTQEFVKKLGRNLDLNGNRGLCSHWAMPQISVSNPEGGIGLCRSAPDHGFNASFSAKSLAPTRRMMSLSASTSLCIINTVILLHLW